MKLREKKKVISYNSRLYEVAFSNKNRHYIGERPLPRVRSLKEKKRIAIIGAGWYGVHIACELKRKHPEWDITLFEKNAKIFRGISGMFGIRLHTGPHYPRSEITRKDCHENFPKFSNHYEKIITPNSRSIYGLGIEDEEGNSSKVTKKEFAAVCEEFGNAKQIQPEKFGFNKKELQIAYDIKEPSVQVGRPLRHFFQKELKRLGVKLKCGTTVSGIKRMANGNMAITYGTKAKQKVFDEVINATSYQAFQSITCSNKVDVVYQVCIALEYKHKVKPLPADPFSFIAMDGWYPCIMPYDDRKNKSRPVSRYILTHGKWTILRTFKTAKEAQDFLDGLNDKFIEKEVKPKCEAEAQRFYPAFCKEFKYKGWKGRVQAKLKTKKEFRSAVTFRDENSKVINIIPGKISNVFNAEEEVDSFLKNQELIKVGNFSYPKNSVFARAQTELAEKPDSQSTTELQSFPDVTIKTKKLSFFSKGNNRPDLSACGCFSINKKGQEGAYVMQRQAMTESNACQLENDLPVCAQTEITETIKSSSHNTTEPQSFSVATTTKTPSFFSLGTGSRIFKFFTCLCENEKLVRNMSHFI